jgi:UDP-glucuronate decarboxylase
MNSNKIILEDLEAIYNSEIDWSRFFNSTILVTGANGFLPAYLVESLLYINYINPNARVKIIALVRNIQKAKNRFSDYRNNFNLKFISQDVSDPIVLSDKIDYIIHAASQASPKFYGKDPVGTLKANVLGTINLMDIAIINKVKSFLYFSSGEVYGEISIGKVPTTESDYGYIDPANVRSCYAESKRMGENICVSYFHQYNVPIKIVRPFHTYGPGMMLNDGRVYADFVSDILNDKDISMNSDGLAQRSFCYLTDATIGFFKVLLNGKDGNAYNVGNPEQEYSILALAEQLVKIYPEKKLRVIKQIQSENNNYLKSPITRSSPNINKIKLLNWSPKISIEDGFKRTIESYMFNSDEII